MFFKYKKESILILLVMFCSFLTFSIIKWKFFHDEKITTPINKVFYHNNNFNKPNTEIASTKYIIKSSLVPTTKVIVQENEDDAMKKETIEIIDDGSIIYDGLTVTELTNKLNKSLNSNLADTGYYFAKFTKDTGIDPYLAVAIVLHESGCKWQCSYLTSQCNNIGGLKGGKRCNNGAYSRFDSLEDGINSYLKIIYNNYFLKGMTTAETMASKYASSTSWAEKVNKYIEEIKNK